MRRRVCRVLHLHLDLWGLLTSIRRYLDLFLKVLLGSLVCLSHYLRVSTALVLITILIVLWLEQFCKLGEFVFCLLPLLGLGRLLAFLLNCVVNEVKVGRQVPQNAALPKQGPKKHHSLQKRMKKEELARNSLERVERFGLHQQCRGRSSLRRRPTGQYNSISFCSFNVVYKIIYFCRLNL